MAAIDTDPDEPQATRASRERGRDGSSIHVTLFDADHNDQVIADVAHFDAKDLVERQLLWIDLLNPSEEDLRGIVTRLSLPEGAVAGALGNDTNPALYNSGECFWLRVVAVGEKPNVPLQGNFPGNLLTLIAGTNLVVSIHPQRIGFIEELRGRESAQSDIGALGAASFTASLLDWHLSSYFNAVSRFEMSLDRLEGEILSEHPRDCLVELRNLRKDASRLRRMLAPHRRVFGGLARPDFRPDEENGANVHFLALEDNYERAMDMVENARDLVVGSFELFSTCTALGTNDSMRMLTFATVVIGFLAVLAGMLGMNFETSFFNTGTPGFAAAAGAMLLLALLSVMIGKKRRWL